VLTKNSTAVFRNMPLGYLVRKVLMFWRNLLPSFSASILKVEAVIFFHDSGTYLPHYNA